MYYETRILLVIYQLSSAYLSQTGRIICTHTQSSVLVCSSQNNLHKIKRIKLNSIDNTMSRLYILNYTTEHYILISALTANVTALRSVHLLSIIIQKRLPKT